MSTITYYQSDGAARTLTVEEGTSVMRAAVTAGVPGIVTAEMTKPGAAVLDVGVSRGADGILGDVAPDVAEVAGWVSPNPGGVGPMTRALLLANVVEAAERQAVE